MWKTIGSLFKGILETILFPILISEAKAKLNTQKKLANAQFFSTIADDIVSAMAAKFPGTSLLQYSKQAVEEFREQTGLSDVNVASRIINAAIGRITKK